jgi:hypothetical protein
MSIKKNQVSPYRVEVMQEIFKTAFAGPIKALEVGSWYGIGSTNIWLDNIKNGSTLTLIDPWRPYHSKADREEDTSHDYKGMDDLSTDAFLSTYLNIKDFEAKSKDRDIKINMVRGESSTVLPLLKDELFDFIYIDGDHKYEVVKSDIQEAKRLVSKKFGIICGDDLEKMPTPELIDIANTHKERDFLRKEKFHPGVLLAISEAFENVNMFNGFWWIACLDGKFDSNIGRLA